MNNGSYPCPCCANKTIDEPGCYEICPVCGWEDDPVQSADPDFSGGANSPSLNEAKRAFNEQYLRLSLQRALLGNVTPNIRAVITELSGKNISLLFYFEGEVDDDDEELASVIETEIIADFDDDFTVDTIVQRLDYPQRIKNTNGLLVYLRKE